MLPIVSIFLHAYVAARLLPALWAWPAAAVSLVTVLLISAFFMPMGIGIGNRLGLRKRGAAGVPVTVGWICMGLFSSLLLLTIARDVLLFVFAAIETVGLTQPPPSGLQPGSALFVWLATLGATAIGFAGARRTAAVVTVSVPIAGLPPALEGFKIAQISDIHVGPTIRAAYLQRIVDAVNRLEADMVAITGDLVDGSVAELADHVAPLAQLQSRHGSFFVTGNHEYYSGAQAWVAELRRLGVIVLQNQHRVLSHDAAVAVVGGVNDFGAAHFDLLQASDPHRALDGAPENAGVRILLAHQPRSAPAAADAGFDLQLSGHTHGGQFLPWNFFVKLQQPFVAGLDRFRQMWVYTSRGTGYWGPPKRFGAPSEITLLRLTVHNA